MANPKLITISRVVPIDEVDYSDCYNDGDPDSSIDLTGATYRGETVTFSDSEYERAEQYIIERGLGQSVDVQCRPRTASPMPEKTRLENFINRGAASIVAGLGILAFTCVGDP